MRVLHTKDITSIKPKRELYIYAMGGRVYRHEDFSYLEDIDALFYGDLKHEIIDGPCVFNIRTKWIHEIEGKTVSLLVGDPLLIHNVVLMGTVRIRGYYFYAFKQFEQDKTNAWFCIRKSKIHKAELYTK